MAGLQAKGLDEAVVLLGSAGKDLRKESTKIMNRIVLQIKGEIQGRIQKTPGVRRSGYPIGSSAIIHRATATEGKIGYNADRFPAMAPAEWGSNAQFVPYRNGGGRFVPQGSMVRRTFPIPRQQNFKFPKYGRSTVQGPGWIIQPVLRARLGKAQKMLDEKLQALFRKMSRRAGL